jgi:uncharacterized membrane protein YhaH (DUF805 family)
MAAERNTVETSDTESFLSDFGGMFNFLMDPTGAARRLPRKFFWIAPLILVSIIYLICGFKNFPLVQQAMMNQPPPPNTPPEQFQKGMQVGLTVQRVALYFSPLIFVIVSAISALIVFATASAIGLKARFLELFNLMAGLSIIGALQIIATSVILHMKGEPQSLADLQPALGLDIFAPVTMNKVAVAFLSFFNVFEIWQIVMAVAIIAVFYRIGKGKAAVTVAPLFLLTLLLKLVGGFFARGR